MTLPGGSDYNLGLDECAKRFHNVDQAIIALTELRQGHWDTIAVGDVLEELAPEREKLRRSLVELRTGTALQ